MDEMSDLAVPTIGVREAARMLGIHYNTMIRMPPDHIPYFKVGVRGDRRYLKKDVEEYIRKRTVGR